MAFDQRSLDDYVDVAERMGEFYATYPNGSLRAADPGKPWELAIVTGRKKDGQETTQTFIVVVAAAYREPGDPAPGIGMAWEVFPGRTPYTLGSELMNAETSAWGRAMAALGIATKRGIASRQEVRLARERQDGLPTNADGSLSRSQTSDAEKDAAGVMTSGQLAEHTGLRRGADGRLPAADRAKVERSTATPDDDQWYDTGPPGESHPVAPGLRKMFGRYAQLGITDDDEMRAHIGGLVGRPVVSRSSLTQAEVTQVNRWLLDQIAAKT